jgi:2-polyprenyl-3-methyl-5-hydroxy-6-metoxy-1,4-benzoquinol methylase
MSANKAQEIIKRAGSERSVYDAIAARENGFLTLQTNLAPDALKEKLRRWEPWSIRVDFSNGVSTKELKRRTPFNQEPLHKFSVVEAVIPFAELSGGKMLDIGCNAGYNSIAAAAKYGLSSTGIDVVQRHIEISRFFSELAGVDAQFHIASAETFSRPREFDVVLHFGTLYHLPNPVLSLRATFENLKPGGYLALETQIYDHPQDPNICYFMHMQHNDPTNFWALSTHVLKKNLELIGFSDVRELEKIAVSTLPEHMTRITIVARKPNPAQEIIKRAMADRNVYDAMAARENEVWGKILPDLEGSQAQIEDAEASAKLGAARYTSSLFRVAQERNLKFDRGLTLGCGAGRRERELVSRDVCRTFHGIDISERAIAAAREIAKEQDLPLTYEVADLNFLELPEKAFDLVVAQTCLHHVLFLERVAEQIWRSLKSDGYLWIHDFIGETQGQYDPKRLSIVNRILAILPEKFRQNTINGRLIAEIKRPEPGRLGSPFESIRSGEIVPVFQRWFTIEWKMEFDAFLRLVVPPGTRAAYLENEDTRALFELLMLLDRSCIEEKIMSPTGGQYLMRPRSINDFPAESATTV